MIPLYYVLLSASITFSTTFWVNLLVQMPYVYREKQMKVFRLFVFHIATNLIRTILDAALIAIFHRTNRDANQTNKQLRIYLFLSVSDFVSEHSSYL